MDEPRFSDPELQLETDLLEQYLKQHSLQRNLAFCVLEFVDPGDHIVPGLNFSQVALSSPEDFVTVIPIKKVPSNGLTTYEFMSREGCFDCFMFTGRTARLLGSNVHITLGFNKTDYVLVIPRAHVQHLEWIELCQHKLRKLREQILCSEHEFKLQVVKGENHRNFIRYCHFELEYFVDDGTKRQYSTTTDQRTIRVIEYIANELKEGSRSIALFDGYVVLLGDIYSITKESRIEYTGISVRKSELTAELSNLETQFYLDLFIKHPDLFIYDHDDHSYPFNSLLLRGYFEFFETFMTTKIGDGSRNELKTPYQSATLDLLHRLIYQRSINYDQLDLSVITEFYFVLDFFTIRHEHLIRRINGLFLELIHQKKLLPSSEQIDQLINLPFLQPSVNKIGHRHDPFALAREDLQRITKLVEYLS